MASKRTIPQPRDRRSHRPVRAVRHIEPPPATLNRFGVPLPVELHCRVADALPTTELKSYMRVCQLTHDVGARIMYHTVEATHEDAVQVFSSLLIRFRPGSARHRRHPPALVIRSLTYTSSSPDDDLRTLPVLCDLLLQTTDLRHLCVEIPDDSSLVLVTLLKRRGLLRRSISPVVAVFRCVEGDGKRLSNPLTLPRLVSFHTTCCRVLGEFSKNRPLKAIALSEVIGQLETIVVLEDLAGLGTNPLVQAFTSFYDVRDSPQGQLWAIGTCFLNLKFLGLEVPTHYTMFAEETYAVLTGLMLNLASASYAYHGLETLSLEFPWGLHALGGPLADRLDIDRVQAIFNVFAMSRPLFQRVLLASLTITFSDKDRRWRVVDADNGEERMRLSTVNAAARVPLY